MKWGDINYRHHGMKVCVFAKSTPTHPIEGKGPFIGFVDCQEPNMVCLLRQGTSARSFSWWWDVEILEQKNVVGFTEKEANQCRICRTRESESWWCCCPDHLKEKEVVCKSCLIRLHPEVQMKDISTIVSKDAETVTNDSGGSQSHVPVRFDLIDAKALFEQAKVLHEGAVKYGENNWRLISVEDHLNHLIMHAYAYLSGDRSDEHLSHIMCRATFAQGVVIGDAENYKKECINE